MKSVNRHKYIEELNKLFGINLSNNIFVRMYNPSDLIISKPTKHDHTRRGRNDYKIRSRAVNEFSKKFDFNYITLASVRRGRRHHVLLSGTDKQGCFVDSENYQKYVAWVYLLYISYVNLYLAGDYTRLDIRPSGDNQ